MYYTNGLIEETFADDEFAISEACMNAIELPSSIHTALKEDNAFSHHFLIFL